MRVGCVFCFDCDFDERVDVIFESVIGESEKWKKAITKNKKCTEILIFLSGCG